MKKSFNITENVKGEVYEADDGRRIPWQKKGITTVPRIRICRLWRFGQLFLLSVIGLFLFNGCLAHTKPPVNGLGVGVESFKFAVLCDTRSDAEKSGLNGVNVAAVKAVSNHLKKQGAEFVLAPGDLICGNVKWYKPAPPTSDDQYSAFLKAAASQGVGLPGSSAAIHLYPVRGNHETYHDIMSQKEVETAWFNNIGYSLPANGPDGETGFTYSFTRNNMLFIGLDQYMHAGPKAKTNITYNQKWLLEQVRALSDVQGVFVFGHTPAFAANHLDCLDDDKVARDKLMTTVSKSGGIYFCGHDHFYARSQVPVYGQDGKTVTDYVEQIITPSGAPFLTGNRSDNHKWNGNYSNPDVKPRTYIDNSIGYQLVTVTGPKITVQYFATQDGSTSSMNPDGVYTYHYNNNWKLWNFAVMDQFSLTIKDSHPSTGAYPGQQQDQHARRLPKP